MIVTMARRRTKKQKRLRFEVYYDSYARMWKGRQLVARGPRWIGCTFVTKAYASRVTRDYAKLNQPSQLFIKGRNGRIQEERTYGDDPRRTPG